MQTIDVLVEVHARWNRAREPKVEFVIAFVVVRHTGMRVDDRCSFVDAIFRDVHRDERGRVSELARVEDRGELTDDAFLVAPPLQTGQDVFFGRAELLGDQCERLWRQGNFLLHRIEQLFVKSCGGFGHAAIVPLRALGLSACRLVSSLSP